MDLNLTQMDLSKWFKNIEYMIGICNSLTDRTHAKSMIKKILKSSLCFDYEASEYIKYNNSSDIIVMINRNKQIIISLTEKINNVNSYPDDKEQTTKITFVEIEKWKQDLMYKAGIMLTMKENEHKRMFAESIKRSLYTLSIYIDSYSLNLKKDDNDYKRKIIDLNTISNQINNSMESIDKCISGFFP
jgi:hypothetical protein